MVKWTVPIGIWDLRRIWEYTVARGNFIMKLQHWGFVYGCKGVTHLGKGDEEPRDVTRTLIGSVYSYIRVLPDGFLLNLS